MENHEIRMTIKQYESNILMIHKYINDNDLSKAEFIKQANITSATFNNIMTGRILGSLLTWKKLEECIGYQFEYENKVKKRQDKIEKKIKTNSIIPEYVPLMLKLHGNTVIGGKFIRKHKKENIYEELRLLGLKKVIIRKTDNDNWLIERIN